MYHLLFLYHDDEWFEERGVKVVSPQGQDEVVQLVRDLIAVHDHGLGVRAAVFHQLVPHADPTLHGRLGV